jgi:hypothetical protein
VFEAYQRHFPEARKVPVITSPLGYFSGVYSSEGPRGRGFAGRVLYLFPDGSFIFTEWLDILPERTLTRGAWDYHRGRIRITSSRPPNVLRDSFYVPLKFTDSYRDCLVLLGTPNGFRNWSSEAGERDTEIKQARARYDRDVRVRKDFQPANQAEEMLYVTFFRGTYGRIQVFEDKRWRLFRTELLARLKTSSKE